MTINRTFLNKVFNFIGIGLALYFIANVYTSVSNDAVIKNTVKCKYCRKRISEKVKTISNAPDSCYLLTRAIQAHRCVNCTSWQDGREEQIN